MNGFDGELDALRSMGCFRTLRTVEPIDGAHVRIDGRAFLSFAANDTLGLRRHPEVVAAAKAALDAYGLGAGASRLLAGTTPAHGRLEEALAEFTGRERALVFPSGYQTNVGVLTSLGGEDDALILDALCHASLIDAARLAKARMRVYPHANVTKLAALLERQRSSRRRIVVTEGVFSMDGDVAPLAQIVALCERHDAWLVLDDAHGLGVLGATGRGTVEALGVALGERSVYVATLSKALGSQGGFAAGSDELVDLLVNRARSFVYTTGLAPACAAGAEKALTLLAAPARREKLAKLSARARERLRAVVPAVPEGMTPIIPVVVGEVDRAVALAGRLLDAGILAPAIRPPTVPKGTARLRISLSADHTEDDVARLADVLEDAF